MPLFGEGRRVRKTAAPFLGTEWSSGSLTVPICGSWPRPWRSEPAPAQLS